MPSDQDENRGAWLDADVAQSMQWALPADAVAPSVVDVDAQFVEEPVDTDDLLELDTTTEDHLQNWSQEPLVSDSLLTNIGRRLSPVLVPLPFALIVFGLTLPITLQRSSALSALATGIMLLTLAILQAVLLYFAGSNDTLWMLAITLGYALFIIGGVFAALGLTAGLIALAVVVVLALFMARRGMHPTREGYVDLVESFGKYSHTLYPGLNLLLPWERVSQSLNTQETVWTTPLQRVQTSREQHVQLTATISYQLLPEDAHIAARKVQNWEAALQTQFISTLQSVVNELPPSDFVSWTQSFYARAPSEASSFDPGAATRWDRISAALSRRIQDQVATWGVQVNWVRIQDLTILPYAPIPGLGLEGSDGGTTQIMRPATSTVEVPTPPETKPAPKLEPTKTPPPLKPGKPLSIEQLVEFYNAVRQGAITEPAMILDLAQRFESLAKDPNVRFDAARAANTLRVRAQKLQELSQGRAATSAGASNNSSPQG
jgi:hypothetical protein